MKTDNRESPSRLYDLRYRRKKSVYLLKLFIHRDPQRLKDHSCWMTSTRCAGNNATDKCCQLLA
jgi:hypothetical protein